MSNEKFQSEMEGCDQQGTRFIEGDICKIREGDGHALQFNAFVTYQKQSVEILIESHQSAITGIHCHQPSEFDWSVSLLPDIPYPVEIPIEYRNLAVAFIGHEYQWTVNSDADRHIKRVTR